MSRRIARRSLERLTGLRRVLGKPGSAAPPDARAVLDALLTTLRAIPEPARLRALLGPDLRGFLAEAALWIEVRRLAAMELNGRRPRGRRARPEVRMARLRTRLFDRVARTPHLVTLVPRGRLDAGFAARCLRFSAARLDDAVRDLAAFLLGLRLAHRQAGPSSVRLRFREDAEQGRPFGRIDLGAVAGPAGALGIVGPAGRAVRPGVTVRAALDGRTLTLRAPGAGTTIVPVAATRLVAPDLDVSAGPLRARPAFRLARRPLVPGTEILLAPLVVSGPRRLRVRSDVPGLGPRLARALRLVRLAWPEAYREIERRTFMVVPIREPGTVSYSMAARPGISFVNVSGKTIVDLADDLLHETAHHRLHDLQETVDLLRRGGETTEVQAFHSPWRRTRRPLHGLLHGGCTFVFRAELFRRLARFARARPRLLASDLGPGGRRFLERERRRERTMVAAALRDLERAARSGLLTPAGRRLVREISVWLAG